MRIYSCITFSWSEEKQEYIQECAEYKEYFGPLALCGGRGGGGGGGGGGTNVNIVRYAPYVEGHHANFLSTVHARRDSIINMSPFSTFTSIPIDVAFFGTGFTISNFPSLYDVYGKFMAGLDIEVLWSQVLRGTIDSPVVKDLITAESVMLEDEIRTNAVPSLQIGMRDINSVMSSSFVVGKSLILNNKIKALSRFSAGIKYNLIQLASGRWTSHLEWNKGVVGVYSEIIKLYFSVKADIEDVNFSMRAKNILWPFTVLDHERAALGALQGATITRSDVSGSSTMARVLGGALSGAAMGAMVGSAWNAPATVAGVGGATVTQAARSGVGWGAGIGAGLGIAAALTY